MLYSIWHPYKHTLAVVYRAFFPVLSILETVGEPVVGTALRCHRKVLYLEKLVAALLLAAPDVRQQLDLKVSTLQSRMQSIQAGSASSNHDAGDQTGTRLALEHLIALCRLLNVYVPALFLTGYRVRQCTWEGRPGGSARGILAKDTLRLCLLLQTHLLNDWQCKEEYVRSISVALLMWQRWMDDLPGCCFVEESCEALLSRMASRCRSHRTLRGFDSTLRLYVTLPLPSKEARSTRGTVKNSLVRLIRSRLRALISHPEGKPFPLLQTTTKGVLADGNLTRCTTPPPMNAATGRGRWV